MNSSVPSRGHDSAASPRGPASRKAASRRAASRRAADAEGHTTRHPCASAGDGNRTRTPFRAWDFKSHASASSATPARVSYGYSSVQRLLRLCAQRLVPVPFREAAFPRSGPSRSALREAAFPRSGLPAKRPSLGKAACRAAALRAAALPRSGPSAKPPSTHSVAFLKMSG
jgi:hypothetical protein